MILLIGLFILLTIILGATIIPRALDWVGKRYSGEILLIVAVAFCFMMALISSLIGLSVAIGAFLMGVIISLANYSKLIKLKVEPMKELFMAVFFISIGTQIYPELVLHGLPSAIIIAASFIIGKILSVGLACYLTDLDGRSSFTIALNLVVTFQGYALDTLLRFELDGEHPFFFSIPCLGHGSSLKSDEGGPLLIIVI